MNELRTKMEQAAHKAADAFFQSSLGGIDRGECGFAWVTITPKHKGNTRLGKEERKQYTALGASKDWTGKTWMIWNPSGYPVQNRDTLAAEAKLSKAMGCLVRLYYGAGVVTDDMHATLAELTGGNDE